MTIETFPVWNIEPDWSDDVTQTLEYKTAILASTTGVEQRIKLRNSPRRYFEHIMRPKGIWKNRLDALLSVAPQGEYYIPCWHESSRMTAAVDSGSSTIVLQGARPEMDQAARIFIQGDLPHQFELAEVNSVTGDASTTTLGTIAPLALDWAKGTRVYRCVSAILSEQPTINRLREDIDECTAKFLVTEPNDWAFTDTYTLYGGYPVIPLETNYGDTQTGGYDRILSDIDNDVGIVRRRDVAGVPYQKFGSTNFFNGTLEYQRLRKLLNYFQGRLAPFWVVYPTRDFELVEPISNGATQFHVRRAGYADLGTPIPGRADIYFSMRTPELNFVLHIIGSAVVDDLTETIFVTTPIPYSIDPDDVLRVSFMGFARLDQDSVDLVHKTDTDGLCNVALAVKSMPDFRVAADWTPPPLNRETIGACGTNGLWYRYTIPDPVHGGTVTTGWVGESGGLNSGDPDFGVDPIPMDLFLNMANVFPAVGGGNTTTQGLNGISCNFGGSAFVGPVPFSAVAYGADVALNPSDAAGSVHISGNSLYVDGASQIQLARASAPSSGRLGLRYWEVTLETNDWNQGALFGIMQGDAALVNSSPTTQTDYLSPFVHPGYYMFALSPPLPGDSITTLAGIVIAFALFTKG